MVVRSVTLTRAHSLFTIHSETEGRGSLGLFQQSPSFSDGANWIEAKPSLAPCKATKPYPLRRRLRLAKEEYPMVAPR